MNLSNEQNPIPIFDIERSIEKEETNQHKIWIIDDNEEYNNSFTQTLSTIENTQLESFSEGEMAIQKIKMLIDKKEKIPELIFMDYRLDEEVEKPKYIYGTDVIQDIVKACNENQLQIPQIIAFSTDKVSNEKLISSGASKSLQKGRVSLKELKEVIKNYNNS